MLRIAAIIAGLIIIALLFTSYVAGVFDTVKLSRETTGPYYLVYKEHRGPYVGIRYILNDVYRFVTDSTKHNVKSGFAIFYDDPSEVAQDSLRSIAGVITDTLVKVSDPYKSGVFEKTEAIVGVFRIRSYFSYVMGTYKFYPALRKYLKKNGLTSSGPVLEIYNSSEKTIKYVGPVNSKESPAPEFR